MTSIERFWAILAPFHHKYWQTRRLTATFIGLSWLIPITLGIIGLQMSEKSKNPDTLCFARARFSNVLANVVAFGINLPVMVIIFILYLIMWIKLLKMVDYSAVKLLRELQELVRDPDSTSIMENKTKFGGQLDKREVRATIWIFLIVISFWICWGSISKRIFK